MGSEWMIVVWERRNKVGKWCQYSAEVCQLLEQCYRKNLTSVCLGDAENHLKSYVVNLKNMTQTSEETGTVRDIQRLYCDETFTNAEQVMWQWRGDSQDSWHCYSASIATTIEDGYKTECGTIDLGKLFQSYPYIINFANMCQINKKSKYHRPIRRVYTSSYPRVKFENGVEVESASNIYRNCSNLLSAAAEESASTDAATKKKPLAKRMSHFWNKLIRVETDSESVPDGAASNESAKKKQCLPQKTNASTSEGATASVSTQVMRHGHGILSDQRHEYATVNGKPWKQPWPPHTPQNQVKPVPGIEPIEDSKKKSKGRKGKKRDDSPSPTDELDILSEFTEEVELPPCDENSEEQICIICYEELITPSSYGEDTTLIKLSRCSHTFHKLCIQAMYDSGPKDSYIQCPTCKTIHGVKQGIQPAGTMVFHVLPYSLPCFTECDTIRIIYDIPPGVQGPEHPHPGKGYSARGFPRHCYLPDNEIGRKVLRLLVQAWERRLIFTIGSSSTTGEQNTVTWNEIHHKTEFGCNRHGHGYPDTNYFENVISELAAQGVTESTYEWFPA